MTNTPLAHRFADYAVNFNTDSIPQACMDEAKRRIIDSLGCAMGAIDSVPATISRALALRATTTDNNGCSVIGTTHASTPEAAAFTNGVLFRYLDFNDTYLSKEPAHPSDNIAAILAIAEMNGNSGKDVLAAIVLAYEIQCRLCDAYSIRSRGWDHVTYGSLSTVIACGWLLGFNKQQYVHAQGLAATPNNAMRQTRVGELSNWKGCAFANASRNGVFATLLANEGMSGPSDIFEGEMGFFAQICGGEHFEVAPMGGEVIDGTVSHQDYMILKTYIKHFPAEYHSQSAIEAVQTMRTKLGDGYNWKTDWKQVKRIRIESFDAAVDIIGKFKEHWAPTHRETADHSMPYIVAATLIDGDITLESFSDEKLQDPDLRQLIQTVTVERNDEMNAGYPEGIPNRITIELNDGTSVTETVAYPLGHAGNPMTDDDVAKKFKPLAERVFDSATVDKQLAKLRQFDKLDTVTEALHLFSRN